MPNKLKPCPFCGEPPKGIQRERGHSMKPDRYYVKHGWKEQECPLANMGLRGTSSKERAIEQWNRRHNAK